MRSAEKAGPLGHHAHMPSGTEDGRPRAAPEANVWRTAEGERKIHGEIGGRRSSGGGGGRKITSQKGS